MARPEIFDFCGCGDVDRALEEYTNKSGASTSTSFGRLGGVGLRLIGTAMTMRRNCKKAGVSHLFHAFAVNCNSGVGTTRIVSYHAADGTQHLTINADGPNGRISATGPWGTIQTPVGSVPNEAHTHVEVHLDVDNAGSVKIFLNGSPDPAAEALTVDTQAGADPVIAFYVYGTAFTAENPRIDLDDQVFADGDVGGAAQIGDVKVPFRQFTGDLVTDFTPSEGMDHFALLQIPVDTAKHVTSPAGSAGDEELLTITNPGIGDPVLAARLFILAEKTDAGTAAMQLRIRDGAVDEDSGTDIFLGTTRSAHSLVITDMPDGGGDLTEAELATLGYGVVNTTP